MSHSASAPGVFNACFFYLFLVFLICILFFFSLISFPFFYSPKSVFFSPRFYFLKSIYALLIFFMWLSSASGLSDSLSFGGRKKNREQGPRKRGEGSFKRIEFVIYCLARLDLTAASPLWNIAICLFSVFKAAGRPSRQLPQIFS